MRYIKSILFTCALLFAYSGEPQSITEDAAYLQSISPKIVVGDGTGSGIAFTRKDANGKPITLIWSAGHVFVHYSGEGAFSLASTNITPEKTCDIRVNVVKNGQLSGIINKTATLIKFSDDDNGQDLAVLKVNGTYFSTNTAIFDLSGRIPEVGEPLYACASPTGLWGTFSTGHYGFIGRNIEGLTFDQTDLNVWPGSSGGGIFSTDRKCVGMSTQMRTAMINFSIPIRRIQEWVKVEHIEWAINPDVPMPNEKELKKLSLYDTHLTKHTEVKDEIKN